MMKIIKNKRGSITVYTLVVLPVMLLVAVLINTNIANANMVEKSMQRTANQVALTYANESTGYIKDGGELCRINKDVARADFEGYYRNIFLENIEGYNTTFSIVINDGLGYETDTESFVEVVISGTIPVVVTGSLENLANENGLLGMTNTIEVTARASCK